VQTLRETLDVPPMEETRRLYQQILANQLPAAPVPGFPRQRAPQAGREPAPPRPTPSPGDQVVLSRPNPPVAAAVASPPPLPCGSPQLASSLEEAAGALRQLRARLDEASVELNRILELIAGVQEDAHLLSERRPGDGTESQP